MRKAKFVHAVISALFYAYLVHRVTYARFASLNYESYIGHQVAIAFALYMLLYAYAHGMVDPPSLSFFGFVAHHSQVFLFAFVSLLIGSIFNLLAKNLLGFSDFFSLTIGFLSALGFVKLLSIAEPDDGPKGWWPFDPEKAFGR